MLNSLVTGIRTLTILPVPGTDARSPASALPWFPLVGGGLGACVWGIALLGGAGPIPPWPQGFAALAVLAGVILTRALHVDGLADWADACGSFGEREKKLAVMKDPRVGAFGLTAVALSLILKWSALWRLTAASASVWIVPAFVVSRTMQVELAGALPYARATGGTASPFVSDAGWTHRILASLLALALLAPLFGIEGIVAFAVGLVIARLFGMWCRLRLGGVTGDLLGAGSEIVETSILMIAALLVGRLPAVPACAAWIP